jgi:hypothetical protein
MKIKLNSIKYERYMGYRTQIGWITKDQYEALEKMPTIDLLKNYKQAEIYCSNFFEEKEEINEDFLKKHRPNIISYIVEYEIGTQIYDFGKNVDFESKFLHNFFDRNFIYTCADTEFYRVNKDFLAHAIDIYKENTIKQLTSYILPFGNVYENGRCEFEFDFESDFSKINKEQEKKIEEMILNVKKKIAAWLFSKNAIDQSEQEKITGSWLYEYAIFELVRISKSFDWDNKVMYLCGG